MERVLDDHMADRISDRIYWFRFSEFRKSFKVSQQKFSCREEVYSLRVWILRATGNRWWESKKIATNQLRSLIINGNLEQQKLLLFVFEVQTFKSWIIQLNGLNFNRFVWVMQWWEWPVPVDFTVAAIRSHLAVYSPVPSRLAAEERDSISENRRIELAIRNHISTYMP